MITPTTQTREGWPYGDCVRASYATILGVPFDSIPRFDPAALGGRDQRQAERQWLASIGLELVEIANADEAQMEEVLDSMPDVYHLMSGLSPRGLCHRCVGFGGRLAFDPHPSRAGLVTVYSVGFLVPQ